MMELLVPISPKESPSVGCCRALALLHVVDKPGRERIADKLTCLAKHEERSHANALLSNGGLQALCFLGRAAMGLSQAKEGLEAIVGKTEFGGQIANKLESHAGLLLELSLGRQGVEGVCSLAEGSREIDKELGTASIRNALDASQGSFQSGYKTTSQSNGKGYTSEEIDAVFYEATAEDAGEHGSLWFAKRNRSTHLNAEVNALEDGLRPLEEDYYVEMQARNGTAGGIATMIANSLANSPGASDDFMHSARGLLALRKLLLHPPDSASYRPAKLALLRAEVARAVGNALFGSSDINKSAYAIVSAGFLPLLSRWSMDETPARGHLQAESLRALHNLSSALQCSAYPAGVIDHQSNANSYQEPLVKQRCRCALYADGVLPFQYPAIPHGAIDNRPAIDVVFVHGLRGSPLMTWRSEDQLPPLKDFDSRITIWPRDLLSKDLPKARILSISYNSSIVALSSSRTATSGLKGSADLLSYKLEQACVGERAVVFVTHSYGGLIVKQLLCNEGRASKVFRKTHGIVFFATPHRGSPLAKQGRIGVTTAVRELLPGPLSPLIALNEEFVEMVNAKNEEAKFCTAKSPCEVVSVGEGEKTQIARQFKVELVPPESADPGVGRFYLYEGTDHQQICKLSAKGDGRYQLVKQLIERSMLYHDVGASDSASPYL